ncbi:MAG: endonuclease/exonuclease/phosphatase family protein [Pseudomonadota bacterium]
MTYNIRKGKGASGRAPFQVADLGTALAVHDVDLLLCQEVFHDTRRGVAQSDELAALVGLPACYGANRLRKLGHHGNATFTRYPVLASQNHDVSTNSLERRGVLYTRLDVDGRALHVLNVHLGLNHLQRVKQVRRIAELLAATVPVGEPVILAGDFNDWRRSLDQVISGQLGFRNAFAAHRAREVRSWHARRPVFNLDRVYLHHLAMRRAERLFGAPWQDLSDHLPLMVDLDFNEA